jgi:hypothetical protein
MTNGKIQIYLPKNPTDTVKRQVSVPILALCFPSVG